MVLSPSIKTYIHEDIHSALHTPGLKTEHSNDNMTVGTTGVLIFSVIILDFEKVPNRCQDLLLLIAVRGSGSRYSHPRT
jgi:hypothetical protein